MKTPLAERLRPDTLDAIVGQEAIMPFLKSVIEKKRPISLLLQGPPGCGKTTLARVYASCFEARFVSLSAVFSGVADIKRIVTDAENQPLLQTVLFVDEIHRFNKAQQDAFLPYMERGVITLVGATTENPSFALNNALLSRLRVLELKALDRNACLALIERYEKQIGKLPITDAAKDYLLELYHGDGRYLYNLLENIETLPCGKEWDVKDLEGVLQRRQALHDRGGDGHYNLVSALHKSVRGSDADAALYWLYRMLDGGEDPLFILRRLIRMATEDVGLADPQALTQVVAARDAYQQLGSPEGDLAIAQATVYLALAPKSNRLYLAEKAAKQLAIKTRELAPPEHILNAPTKLMKEQGYGKGYIYDHDTPKGISGQNYFPKGMQRERFYEPVERGFERDLKKRIAYFDLARDAW